MVKAVLTISVDKNLKKTLEDMYKKELEKIAKKGIKNRHEIISFSSFVEKYIKKGIEAEKLGAF